MKKICCLLLLFCSLGASAQKDSVQALISRFFEGLSNANESAIRATVTADFELLENGEVWNMQTLADHLRLQRGRSFTRTNEFRFITTEEQGNMAWVSYDNRATITSAGQEPRKLHWLESAVLLRQKGQWKIRMLHSTRIPESAKTGQ
jgi:ketosteroid isomerase-like protein